MERRTAASHAGALLPHLRPGMSLVDAGCGPGSITVGLARALVPGRVVAVDSEPSQAALARERGAANVEVVVAPATDLPLPADAVDAAFAARGLTRRVRVVVSTMPALLDVLPGTDLVGFTPDVGALRPGLARVVLPEEAVVTSYELWWGHRADDDAAGAWFRHELVDVAPPVCG